MNKNRQALREIMAYGIFGVLTTVVNLVVYQICLKGQLAYGIANTIAFVVSILFAFITNRHYVFMSRQTKWRGLLSEFIRFLMARLGTFLLETLGLWVMIDLFHMDESLPKYVMTVVVIVLNYFLSKKMVFN